MEEAPKNSKESSHSAHANGMNVFHDARNMNVHFVLAVSVYLSTIYLENQKENSDKNLVQILCH
jgi:hypothetical protein